MYLHEIKPGERIFIDANIFVYHFSQASRFNKSCREFFLMIENSEIHGVTSAAIVQEATHRLMMTEASSVIDAEVKNLPKYLKQNPDVVKKLTKHLSVPGKIAALGVEIIPFGLKTIEGSQTFKTEYGLLSNDALSLMNMKELGITAIASNDSDFNRVPWLNLYLPYTSD